MANSAISALPVATNGLILLEEQSAGTDPSIDFTSNITSEYDIYIIECIDVVPVTDGAAFWMRTSADAGTSWDSGATDYEYRIFGDATGTTQASTGDTKIILHQSASDGGLGSDTAEASNFTITLFNPAGTDLTVVRCHSTIIAAGRIPVSAITAAFRDSAAAVNGAQFLMSTGNIESGTFKLYGVKDSEGATTTSSAATQSEMEAGTSTTTFVSPGRSQYHPSAAKAWIKFTGEGTIAISASYNTTSITDITTGEYTWTIATDFSGADWCFQGAVESEGGAGTFGRTINIQDGEQAAGTVNVITGIAATTTVDVTTVHCAGYGDQ